MAYVIAEPCIDHMDQMCIDVCPVECISFAEGIDRKLYIDPDTCIDCGSCADACPNDAVFRTDQLPREWAGYARIDATWQQNPGAAREAIERIAITG